MLEENTAIIGGYPQKTYKKNPRNNLRSLQKLPRSCCLGCCYQIDLKYEIIEKNMNKGKI